MFKKPFSSNSKDISYLDIQKIYNSINFSELDNDNFNNIYELVNTYIQNHENSKYIYELSKRFILGISVALENKKIDLKGKNEQYGFIAAKLEPNIVI